MGETTEKDRHDAVDALQAMDGRLLSPEAVLHLYRDADRLAQIERQVRELADELREEMDAHNQMRSFQEYEGGRIDKACSIEERLRAIIDPPDGEG